MSKFEYYCNVYHKAKIIYFVTPRCASGSVQCALRRYLTDTQCLRVKIRSKQHGRQIYCFDDSRLIYTDELPPYFYTYFKFSVVRNPFDRLPSSYYEFLETANPMRTQTVYFQEFVKYFLTFINNIIWIPQSKLIPIHGVPGLHLDLLLRFERLSQDWEYLIKRFDVKDLPHKHKTNDKRPYEQYYTAETLRLAQEYYKEDLETFGYQFVKNEGTFRGN
jgi:hypothetical protein